MFCHELKHAHASLRGTLTTHTHISYHSPAAVFVATSSLWHWGQSTESDIDGIMHCVLLSLVRLRRHDDGSICSTLCGSSGLGGITLFGSSGLGSIRLGDGGISGLGGIRLGDGGIRFSARAVGGLVL